MSNAIQIKLLAAILGILVVIAGLLVRGGRPAQITQQQAARNTAAEQTFRKFSAPSTRHQIVP